MNVLYSTPKKFISIIQAIAEAYSLDLEAERAYLRLEKELEQNNPSSPLILVIEKLDQNIVKVSHYCQDEQFPLKAIAFLAELRDDKDDYWTPLEIVQGSYSRQVVSLDPDGSFTQFDSPGTQFAAQLCQAWVEESQQQQWHLNGKPVAGITATSRYFPPLAVSRLAEEPWLHLDSDYCIQGNLSGLLALIEAAAKALALQSETITEVFDAHCNSHYFKVTPSLKCKYRSKSKIRATRLCIKTSTKRKLPKQ